LFLSADSITPLLQQHQLVRTVMILHFIVVMLMICQVAQVQRLFLLITRQALVGLHDACLIIM
jgi:hypothetical protein